MIATTFHATPLYFKFDCLQMTNYVGQKDVENTLHQWMGAVLCLLAMNKDQRANQAEMYRDPDLDRMILSLHSCASEWQSVCTEY